MIRALALTLFTLVLASCVAHRTVTTDTAKTIHRQPDLKGLQLVEGLNVIDRAPTGVSIAALVRGNDITNWRVFGSDGEIAFGEVSNYQATFADDCILTGGTPGDYIPSPDVECCCWDNWGCLCCSEEFQECEMYCDTQRCRDANNQALSPVDPDDPAGQRSVAVTPDRLVIAVDGDTPGWSVVDTAGVLMHIPLQAKEGICRVCTEGQETNVCWDLPCLPVTIEVNR